MAFAASPPSAPLSSVMPWEARQPGFKLAARFRGSIAFAIAIYTIQSGFSKVIIAKSHEVFAKI
jgi:hypothetical protein